MSWLQNMEMLGTPPYAPGTTVNWQTVAINQSHAAGTNYPLTDPPDPVKYLLGDLFLSYEDDGCDFVLPFRVTHLYRFNTDIQIRREMIIVDANGTTVISTYGIPGDVFPADPGQWTDRGWGNQLRTMTWYNDTVTLRCTMRTKGPPWDPWVITSKPLTINLSPGATLDNRCIMRMPRRVKSIRVGLDSFKNEIELAEGYNCRLQNTSPTLRDGGRYIQQIRIRMNSGDGLGRVPGCDDADVVVKRINTVEPTTNGDFTLAAAECYRVQRPSRVISTSPRQVEIASPTDLEPPWLSYATGKPPEISEEYALASVQLFNDCGPCCSCDDFIRVYEGLRRVNDRYLAISQRAEAARDQHRANITRWQAQRDCRLANSLRLVVQAEPRCQLFVGGLRCSMTGYCTQNLVLRLTFETFNDGTPTDLSSCAELKCRETVRSGSDTDYQDEAYLPDTTYPVLDSLFEQTDAQSTSRFRTRVKMCCDANNLDTARVTLTAHLEDDAYFDPDTGQRFSPGDPVTVPTEVQDIWTAAGAPVLPAARAILQKTVSFRSDSGCGGCT